LTEARPGADHRYRTAEPPWIYGSNCWEEIFLHTGVDALHETADAGMINHSARHANILPLTLASGGMLLRTYMSLGIPAGAQLLVPYDIDPHELARWPLADIGPFDHLPASSRPEDSRF